MRNYSTHVSTKKTNQKKPILGKTMVENSEGAYVFEASDQAKLLRFLMLGTEGGSFYANEQKLTVDNAKTIIKMIKGKGQEVLQTVLDVSTNGKAAKNDTAIFVLGLLCTFGSSETKVMSYTAITKVCRTGTHLFQFCQTIQDLRGWSRGLRRGVAAFYNDRSNDEIAYQLIKYRQRNGWEHRDVLRLAHPFPIGPERNGLFQFAVGRDITDLKHPLIEAFKELQGIKGNTKPEVKKAINLLKEYKLPWEALPTQLLKEAAVWQALLDNGIPYMALIRNLSKFAQLGLTVNALDKNTTKIVNDITNKEYLKRSKAHPLFILNAMKTYSQGHGFRGNASWTPVNTITEALNDAFYLAFENVEPTGKNILVALDVSSSMTMGTIAGTSLTPREASAALALVTLNVEKNVGVVGFTHGLIPLKITKSQRLDNVIEYINTLDFGETDCAIPMLYAMKHRLDVDVFQIYTDSETHSGSIHPTQALETYRKFAQKKSKLVVVGMMANDFTIADPSDPNQLDVVGFSTDTPQALAIFAKM